MELIKASKNDIKKIYAYQKRELKNEPKQLKLFKNAIENSVRRRNYAVFMLSENENIVGYAVASFHDSVLVNLKKKTYQKIRKGMLHAFNATKNKNKSYSLALEEIFKWMKKNKVTHMSHSLKSQNSLKKLQFKKIK